MELKQILHRSLLATLIATSQVLAGGNVHAETRTTIDGPPNSGVFGKHVAVLSNGNIVVVDPEYDFFEFALISNVGAVHLYDGVTLNKISTLRGSRADDAVGGGGITVLANGNFVISSPSWDNAAKTDVGAVTLVNGTTGRNGVVSEANSLIGASAGDAVGDFKAITALPNGHYVVASPNWDNGAVVDAGAFTWCNGATVTSGEIGAANSMLGASPGDSAELSVVLLSNGNYVVVLPNWNNGAIIDAGAVVWANGENGPVGSVSANISLLGGKPNDRVGSGGVLTLTLGNYVVLSPEWDNGLIVNAGAATWVSGASGLSTLLSAAVSLIGSHASDAVGSHGSALANGNYVVNSPSWDDGVLADVGAATWGNGATGVTGAVSRANSLVGRTPGDAIGSSGGLALQRQHSTVIATNWGASRASVFEQTNINYVILSPQWDSETAIDTGAATWVNGATGLTGVVNPANSLIGGRTNDRVGSSVTNLPNGNFIVISKFWQSAAGQDVGAATWIAGATGLTGVVNPANSLIGNQNGDFSSAQAAPFANGNYVVAAQSWNRGAIADAGAITWCEGSRACTGVVSVANSLVGEQVGDRVGAEISANAVGDVLLAIAPDYDNGVLTNVGAATWLSATRTLTGSVGVGNSLLGASADDLVGRQTVPLADGNFVLVLPGYDREIVNSDMGALTWVRRAGQSGLIDATNSVIGAAKHEIGDLTAIGYDAARQRLVLGLPQKNIVTLIAVVPEIDVFQGGPAVNNGDDINFGSTQIEGGIVDRVVTLHNPAEGVLTISSISENHTAYQIIGPTSGVLRSGEFMTTLLRFDPASTGLNSAGLTILSNDANEGNYSIQLIGQGAEGVATATPTTAPVATATTPVAQRKQFLPVTRRGG